MKAKCSLQFQDTLESCDMTYEEWQAYTKVAEKPTSPGSHVAKKITSYVQRMHIMRLHIQGLQRRLSV
jgi:hypothetical protein